MFFFLAEQNRTIYYALIQSDSHLIVWLISTMFRESVDLNIWGMKGIVTLYQLGKQVIMEICIR